MTPRVCVCLLAVGTIVSCNLSSASEEAVGDEQLLRKAGFASEDRALLEFFRQQTADESKSLRVRQLIEQLGSDFFWVREKASEAINALGPLALPFLRQAIRDSHDLEVKKRSRDCLKLLETRWSPTLAIAAMRLLVSRQPIGTAETLLAFMPGPYDEWVTEEIQNALIEVARLQSEGNAVFLRFLLSPLPRQRMAAAVALCRCDSRLYGSAIRPLLNDSDANVRLSVARELASAGYRQAVPVLIELLVQLPAEESERAEELLYRLAGPQAPLAPLGSDLSTRQKSRDAWMLWWRSHSEHFEMASLKDLERQLGYTLLVLLNDNRVVEWDREGKARWQIDGLASPLDAEVLPDHRVLIAEHDLKRVTERTFKGEIVWEKKLTEPPIHAQRLADGTTFIVTRNQLVEVDRAGNGERIRYRSEEGGIITARRFRDGRIACIGKGAYFELSATGQELRRFAAPPGVFTTNALTLLPNGHFLLAAYGGGTVQEYDRSGKIVWEIKMGRPLCALRLPGGHTLVSSQDMVLVEFDRSGKEVSRYAASGHPCQIRRR